MSPGDCAAPRLVKSILSAGDVLFLHISGLQEPLRLLYVSVLQETVLLLDVSDLQEPLLLLDIFGVKVAVLI